MKRRAITGLRRFRGSLSAGFAAGVFLAGCSGAVSSRTVRQQVSELGGANLNPDDIQVQRVVDELGGRTIAEANVRLAFQFEEGPDGEMRIVAVRLGTGQWLDVAQLLAAIDAGNVRRTEEDIGKLADGLLAYQEANGELPRVAGAYVSDLLHPLFMNDLVRDDAWGGPIAYDRTATGFELRSPGPDGISGNGDDVFVTEDVGGRDLPTP